MENVSADDLHKEISRLWEKVGVASFTPVDPLPSLSLSVATANDVAWETVSMLNSRYRRQEARANELLEAREKALCALKERQVLLETELGSLRQRARADDELVVAEVLDMGSRLDAAQKVLTDERAAHEAERRELQALVDAARESSEAVNARWRAEERRWETKEQQYLLDLQELQALAARRQESEDERVQAIEKISEVEGHCEELSRIWEEERRQWRELWDRERSAWEIQRLEISAREENLRKEREAWRADISAKDQVQVEFAEQLARNLRDTSANSEKLAVVMGRIAELEHKPSVRFGAGALSRGLARVHNFLTSW